MMDDLEVVYTCPLGSVCREVKDNKVHQCRWYVQMKGQDASGQTHDKWGCAIEWMPILQVETSGNVSKMNASLLSLRNLQDERQRQAINALKGRKALSESDDA